MADEEPFRTLREGIDAWNQWRKEHPHIQPDLSEVDLRGADLRKANLARADLSGARFSEADLFEADVRQAYLRGANLSGANLNGARLSEADLSEADLSEADLSGAILILANLSGANLFKADLRQAHLIWANLKGASLNEADLKRADLNGTDLKGASLFEANLNATDLKGADLSQAEVGRTMFCAVDLSDVKGLESVRHYGPSTIGIDTVYRSKGRIPEGFLRGAGVPDEFITYLGSLVGRAIEYYSCFISYSSKDQEFAERLHADLQAQGVRCWFAPKDMKIGDKIWDRLDQSIRLHDKLLVILSSNSIGSEWVEDEVTTAYEEERKRGKMVLFPVRLDDAVMGTGEVWAAKVRQRHIGDFRAWKEHDKYRQAFQRLVRDLKAG